MRFNIADFDVEMFVIHPRDYRSSRAEKVSGKIFPNKPGAPEALRKVTADAQAALAAQFPDAGADPLKSVVVLREDPPPS